ncbi:tyrosine-type recombinase/integrase [Paramagnetospirillum magneticum]|uniref:Integrase n=1 Tax=Paramagnetospirillum magneticum (strain ATCC 700264 / AMB-1) TaxID=342108 RepID=Q2WA33_PARM1|nr:integrase arm-type DNA-binding domain-containing protein [Paramagnetospirillum magneticum]BAE49292.1 Integrase [Paramagnetospirillum magneticum AMB-1]
MPLTDLQIKAAKPADKPIKLADGGGMFLLVTPQDQRYWRLKYRFGGKEKLLALGVYPDVTIKTARQLRDDAKKQLANGIDPSDARKAKKSSQLLDGPDSFENVAREWFAKNVATWAETHSSKVLQRLESDVFPLIGTKPIGSITAPMILAVARKIEARGANDTAHRAVQNAGQIMRYAVATGRAERDPTGDLRGALPPVRHKHFAALTDPKLVGELLRAFDAFEGTVVVKAALQLAPLVFVRPGELRKAKWADIDLDAGSWAFHASKARKGETIEHLVPLSTQAVEILRDLHQYTGNRECLFPGRDPRKPMSEAAVNAALRRLGYDTKTEITGHGFRAMARTILAEQLGEDPHVIEQQLAHRVPDALGRAYNRTKYIEQRRAMMQRWSDYLDTLKAGAEVIQLPQARGRHAN